MRELTFPFPVYVIAGLLGLPKEDLPRFHRWAVGLISVAFDFANGLAAAKRLGEYLTPIIEARRAHPQDDIISVLTQAELEGTRLDNEHVLGFLRLLLPAGAETTYRSSSNLIFGLLTHPEQLEAVRRDRSLIPRAMEEGLRWETPLTGIGRLCTEDTEVCGVRIPKGAMVQVSLGAANRDETRWEKPDEVRHLPPAEAAHGLRVRAAPLPGHGPRAHGDRGRAQRGARPAAEPAPRPRGRGRAHHGPDLPRAAASAGPVRLSPTGRAGALRPGA